MRNSTTSNARGALDLRVTVGFFAPAESVLRGWTTRKAISLTTPSHGELIELLVVMVWGVKNDAANLSGRNQSTKVGPHSGTTMGSSSPPL